MTTGVLDWHLKKAKECFGTRLNCLEDKLVLDVKQQVTSVLSSSIFEYTPVLFLKKMYSDREGERGDVQVSSMA